MATTNSYRQGETVEISATIKDAEGDAADPSVSTKVRIKDKDGDRQVLDADMSYDETGKYYYAYDLAADAGLGRWPYEVIATDGAGSDVSIGSGSFMVKARVA